MKKIMIWITAISAIVLVIAMVVMGIAIYEMEEDIISTTAYIALPCIVLMFGGLVYIRWSAWKCPHCGRIQLIKGKFCPYCGKEIN